VTSRPRRRRARRLRGALLGLFLAGVLAGCVSVPSGGPVNSYEVTQGPGGQSQPYPQAIAQPPGNGWLPGDIVRGFLTASASFGARQEIAREYLTPSANHSWKPGWSAVVYGSGPTVESAVYAGAGPKETATVTIGGSVQAILSGNGGYAVPSTSAAGGQSLTFTLEKEKSNGQWRITKAPQYLLLTSYQFQYDYQLRNLYFFDPTLSYLVPDPVYVPLQATTADLMGGLVSDLIHPPEDWLSRATVSAFPKKTTMIGDVTLSGGTAAINLGGSIAKAPNETEMQWLSAMQRVSAQLLWTLVGSGESGPAVQSVQLSVNGRPWTPIGSDLNPVQQLHQSKYSPPTGASSLFYYADSTGNLLSSDGPQGKRVKVSRIGTGYSQIAVSPDEQYLAALRNGSLYIGRVGGPLAKRGGTDYTSMSWDQSDNLWATSSDQIVMLHGAADPDQPQGKPVPVDVVSLGDTPNIGPFTALRVAPDGVRVAIIVGGTALDFGAIVSAAGARPGQATVEIVLSPFSVSAPGSTFTAVTWYGPDNVITLGDPGPQLTEYPVDGGSSTSIPAQPRMSWITASLGNPLIGGMPGGAMVWDASLSGTWTVLRGTGVSAVYPG
jgi:Lipoprotein LpqB beta-propeller domain/Sporulation and spore germination